ncbi:protein white isoform X3 [Diabrotica virgifera virgifera]|uniref:Protein white n=1 Tax=Diabrotica virgifera virgifera TaxID=50390 RepID=A0ABM5K5Q3_DIAVI|nr:protein white isoform X3 [Diabrotica virgifera virgifera]
MAVYNRGGREEESSASESLSLAARLGLRVVRDYGTDFRSVGRVIPIEERMKFTWNDINVFAMTKTIKNKFCCFGFMSHGYDEHILKSVDGVACSGELLAILGSSGSGKTTLLNALTYLPMDGMVVSGMRCINGVPVDGQRLRNVSAFVQQDDCFITTLTVREHLVFQALVRMERGVSYNQRLIRVDEVLSELLLKKCENTIIGSTDKGGISGGERKRLTFASEMLTNPHIMFCDEPTSGLDSFMALQVVQALKAMAQNGRTVICTIHQPSSELYVLFDKIMLMTEGITCFLGTREDADGFFITMGAGCPRNYNPADYFVKLLSVIPDREESCRQAIALIADKFHNSNLGRRLAADSAYIRAQEEVDNAVWLSNNLRPYRNSCWAQFRAVLWRSWISMLKDPLIIKVRFLQTVITSLLIGMIYYGQELNEEGVMNINGVLFIFLTNMTFQNVYAVIHVFTAELPVFLREHRSGMYRTDVYFISKTLAELPFFIIIPVAFTTVCYYLIGLNGTLTKYFITCGIVILVANAALSYGYLVSCISRNTSMALTLGAPLVIPFLLFGGYFMNLGSLPHYLKWLSYFSWFRFGNEALMINQWENITDIDCSTNSTICPKNGHVILETYNFAEENFTVDIIALCMLILGFRFFAYLALLNKTCSC